MKNDRNCEGKKISKCSHGWKMFSKGIFSLLYLKAYGEYVGSGIYFSKLIDFLKFIFYQLFVGMIIFLKSIR